MKNFYLLSSQMNIYTKHHTTQSITNTTYSRIIVICRGKTFLFCNLKKKKNYEFMLCKKILQTGAFASKTAKFNLTKNICWNYTIAFKDIFKILQKLPNLFIVTFSYLKLIPGIYPLKFFCIKTSCPSNNNI